MDARSPTCDAGRVRSQRVARFVATNPAPRIDDVYNAAVQRAARRYAEAIADGAERLAAAAEAEAALETELMPPQRARRFRTLLTRYVAKDRDAESAFLDRAAAAPTNWDAVSVAWEELLSGLDALEGASAIDVPALVIAGELERRPRRDDALGRPRVPERPLPRDTRRLRLP
jgi:pimeloyl-ACP methyl ester carboxylesterase